MGNYRDNRGGGGRGYGGRSNFGGSRGGGGDREMTKTTCSNCGKECEVPFKPTGSKPVYCNDCFKSRGGGDRGRSDDRGSRGRSFGNGDRSPAQPQYGEQFTALNTKLDEILKLLGKSTPPKKPKAPKPEVKEEVAPTEVFVAEPVAAQDAPEMPQVPSEETVVEEA